MNRNDREFMAQKIRTQYMEKGTTELDELRALDRKVKKPANVFAYIFGSLSAIIMGAGMSLVMTDMGASVGISDPLVPGIVIGIVGIVTAIVNYPVYKGILGKRKKQHAEQIIALSDRIMNK